MLQVLTVQENPPLANYTEDLVKWKIFAMLDGIYLIIIIDIDIPSNITLQKHYKSCN